MALLERYLYVRKSLLPGAGKGLFTKIFIPKGSFIVEYKGRILTWREAEKMPDERNSYFFYFNMRYVIDAWKTKKSVAHFANDAHGLTRVKGLRNNADYVTRGKRCFIEATRDIPARSEIFVDYGREYWQAVRSNIREDIRKSKESGKAGPLRSRHHLAPKRLGHR